MALIMFSLEFLAIVLASISLLVLCRGQSQGKCCRLICIILCAGGGGGYRYLLRHDVLCFSCPLLLAMHFALSDHQ